MRFAGLRSRRARLLEGEIEFERAVYECPRCRRSLAPLDGELGLGPHEQLGRLVQKKAAYAAACGSFTQASRDLRHQAELEVSPAEIARVAERVGCVLDELQREREEQWNEPVGGDHNVAKPEIACERLVLQADATSVLTVSGEENKMVYVGTAFDASSRGRKESGRPVIGERRYGASAEDFEDFAPRLRALAHRMGARQAAKLAFVGDGASYLWKWAQENLSEAVMIQAPWHVFDRLSKLLEELGHKGAPKQAQLGQWSALILESRAGEVIEQLGQERKRRRGLKRKRLEEEIGYLENSRHRMDYARYRQEGWLIGSGAIEATCKHLVKERFGLSGARWKRSRLRFILALRLSIFNEEWKTDWDSQALRPAA
jgi:hypothetical protein